MLVEDQTYQFFVCVQHQHYMEMVHEDLKLFNLLHVHN